MKRNVIKKLNIKLFLTVAISLLFISNAYAFGNNGHFKKLRNTPFGEGVYYSSNEIFFPEGHMVGKNQAANPSAKIWNVVTRELTDLNVTRKSYGGKYFNFRDGRIISFGGCVEKNSRICKTTEVYDIYKNKFYMLDDSNYNHYFSSNAIQLDDNRVFLINASNMEIFDPKTNSFTIVGHKKTTDPKLKTICSINDNANEKFCIEGAKITLTNLKTNKIKYLTREEALKKYPSNVKEYDNYIKSTIYYTLNYYQISKAVKLNDGRIYIVGIPNTDSPITGYYAKAEIFDPKTNKSIPAKCPKTGLRNMVTLQDGRVLLLSGYVYDPGTDTLSETGSLNVWRDDQSKEILLSNGKVLIVGGIQFLDGWLYKNKLPIEIFNPAINKYKKMGKKYRQNYTPQLIDIGNNNIFINSGKDFLYSY